MSPLPNEHSCRLSSPDKYDEFRRKNCEFKHDNKCIDVIYGIWTEDKERKSEIQALRYDKKIWTEASARAHCKEKEGIFEPAEEEKEEKDMKLGILYRNFGLERSAINQDTRTVELSFSSEEPMERFFGIEILDHNNNSVRLNRLKKAGVLLLDHDPTKQIGVVEKIFISDDRKGRAKVRFGKSALAEEIFQDVLDEIRKNVSVGYQIHQMILEEDKETKVYRAIDWEPMEISIVAIPGDINIGIGRSEDIKEVKIFKKGGKNMCEKCKSDLCICQSIDVDNVMAKAKKEELSRVREIMAIAKKFDCGELAQKYIEEGLSVADFKSAVLESKFNAKPIQTLDANIGMSNKDIRQYSIVKAIREIAEHKILTGLEKEASDATAKIAKREPKGFFIPHDVMTRTLQAGVAEKGGYLIGTDVLATEMIELLRNKPMVAQLGARTLSGLVGNIAIPRVTGGAIAYWLPETGEVPATSQTFGQIGLVPHRLVGDTAYTKELVMQASIDVEAFVRDDLMTVLAIEKDRAAINGSGAAGEPVGILNTTGVKTVTFGGAATWGKVVDFETQLADSNADIGNMAYLTTPVVRGKWKTIPVVSGQAIFLWDKDGTVNSYRAEATKQVPDNKVIFANWSDFIFAEWAGIDVVVDPFSLKKQGMIEVTITLWCDMAVRHPVSFCVSTDSGAQ